jgi:hypothetical protein
VPGRRVEPAPTIRMTSPRLAMEENSFQALPVPAAWDRVKNQVFGMEKS